MLVPQTQVLFVVKANEDLEDHICREEHVLHDISPVESADLNYDAVFVFGRVFVDLYTWKQVL